MFVFHRYHIVELSAERVECTPIVPSEVKGIGEQNAPQPRFAVDIQACSRESCVTVAALRHKVTHWGGLLTFYLEPETSRFCLIGGTVLNSQVKHLFCEVDLPVFCDTAGRTHPRKGDHVVQGGKHARISCSTAEKIGVFIVDVSRRPLTRVGISFCCGNGVVGTAFLGIVAGVRHAEGGENLLFGKAVERFASHGFQNPLEDKVSHAGVADTLANGGARLGIKNGAEGIPRFVVHGVQGEPRCEPRCVGHEVENIAFAVVPRVVKEHPDGVTERQSAVFKKFESDHGGGDQFGEGSQIKQGVLGQIKSGGLKLTLSEKSAEEDLVPHPHSSGGTGESTPHTRLKKRNCFWKHGGILSR